MAVSYLEGILKKKKNNFIITVVKVTKEEKKVIFSKTCGSLPDIKGSKKYTTVALELLGRESFLLLIKKGYRKMVLNFIMTSKIDKFLRSFVRGFLIYGDKYVDMLLRLEIIYTHNGVRSRKLRRV